jgi:hypothetical protein
MGSLVGIELLGSGPLVGGDKNGFIVKGRDGVEGFFSVRLTLDTWQSVFRDAVIAQSMPPYDRGRGCQCFVWLNKLEVTLLGMVR